MLVYYFPAFSRIRTEYGEILRISPYSVRMQENAGPEITAYLDTFHAAPIYRNICQLFGVGP